MVRVPSQHGLQKKFKPWRKGKSVKAKKQGSLKQQLRGLERLLAKLTRSGESDEATTARAAELRTSIASMKAQIAEKESQEQEREHANKSHGTRFLERQRLTRMERTVRKGCSKDKNRELLQIAMDQIYVAHYPLSKPYRPLFKNKKRHLHHSVSRAQLRNSILQDLKNNKIERVNWISQEQYASLPSDWSVMEEVEFFNYPNGGKSKKAKTTSNDNRFSVNSKHDVLLEAANRLESKLDKKEKQEVDARDLDVDDVETEGSSDESRHDDEAIEAFKSINYTKRKRGGDSSSSSDSDDSSDASADPLQRNGKAEASRILTKEALQEDLDSSNNRNSTNERIERKFQKQPTSLTKAAVVIAVALMTMLTRDRLKLSQELSKIWAMKRTTATVMMISLSPPKKTMSMFLILLRTSLSNCYRRKTPPKAIRVKDGPLKNKGRDDIKRSGPGGEHKRSHRVFFSNCSAQIIIQL